MTKNAKKLLKIKLIITEMKQHLSSAYNMYAFNSEMSGDTYSMARKLQIEDDLRFIDHICEVLEDEDNL